MDARKQIENQIAGAVVAAVNDPTVDASRSAAKPIADAVAAKVVPVVVNATNQEPWYQSNVTMGALTVIAFRLLAHFGYAVPQELHGPILDALIAFGPYIAAGWVIAGRWLFRLPLGEGPILRRLLFWRRK